MILRKIFNTTELVVATKRMETKIIEYDYYHTIYRKEYKNVTIPKYESYEALFKDACSFMEGKCIIGVAEYSDGVSIYYNE